MRFFHSSLGAAFLSTASAALVQSQNDTWNSTYQLTPAQIQAANLSAATAHNFEVALNYERSNYAGGRIEDDHFYDLPGDFDINNPPPPGTLLKVEENTNTSLYTIPPSLGMSRFLYTSETLNGSSIPASAYILWPYLPRSFRNVVPCHGGAQNTSAFPVIALAHGSSGQTRACAPSHIRGLWDDFHNPFPLALAGYAVVAPDYAGLGVANITSPYFILPSQANDLFRAVEAAQKAWPEQLPREFVVAGQSQGGGVAWAAAQRQAQRPVAGYLGTVAASPFTDTLADIAADPAAENNARVVAIAQGLNSVLSSFDISDWITDAGIARLRIIQATEGCGTAGSVLFGDLDVQILKDGWNTSSASAWYRNNTLNGGKDFAAPMLVIQGTEDPNANEPVTTEWVGKTCAAYPHKALHYIRWEGITHVPVLYAGQHLFLDWIRERFEGVQAVNRCYGETYAPARGPKSFLRDQNWFVEYDLYGI